MQDRNAGLTADELFVGATRPSMRWGVTYSALLFNMVFTMEVFLMAKNPLILLLAAPIHGVCMLLCARDARFFDLLLLWGRTRIPAFLTNLRFWRASSHSPLVVDVAGGRGRRSARTPVNVRVWRGGSAGRAPHGGQARGRAPHAALHGEAGR